MRQKPGRGPPVPQCYLHFPGKQVFVSEPEVESKAWAVGRGGGGRGLPRRGLAQSPEEKQKEGQGRGCKPPLGQASAECPV